VKGFLDVKYPERIEHIMFAGADIIIIEDIDPFGNFNSSVKYT